MLAFQSKLGVRKSSSFVPSSRNKSPAVSRSILPKYFDNDEPQVDQFELSIDSIATQ
jgi:hypothetical protein